MNNEIIPSKVVHNILHTRNIQIKYFLHISYIAYQSHFQKFYLKTFGNEV